MSVLQLCRRNRDHIRLRILGPRATDCMILGVAGPDDPGSIAPSARSGLRCKGTDGPGPPRSPEQRLAPPRQMGGGWITSWFPDAPALLLTLLPRYSLHSLVARHPVALADSPAPRQDSGSPRPVCTRSAKLYRYWRARRRLRWARLCRDLVRPPTPRSPLGSSTGLPTPRDIAKKDD